MRRIAAILGLGLLSACAGDITAVTPVPMGDAAAADSEVVLLPRASGVEAFIAADYPRSGARRIAVLPFKLKRDDVSAGERRKVEALLTQTFRNRFSAIAGYDHIPWGEVQEAMRAQGLSPTAPVPLERIKDVVAAVKADAIITGDIPDYGLLNLAVYAQIAVSADVTMTSAAGKPLWRARKVEREHRRAAIPTTPLELLSTLVNASLDMDDRARVAVIEELMDQIVAEAPPAPRGGAAGGKAAMSGFRLVSATHNAGGRPLKIGDEIKFAAALTQQGQVQVRVGDAIRVSLRQAAQPGPKGETLFEGNYRVRRGDKLADQDVVYSAVAGEAKAEFVDPLAAVSVDTDPPDAPSGLAAAAADDKLQITWTASKAGDVVAYEVHRSATPLTGFAKLADSEFTRFVDDRPLTPSGFYRVLARDAAGNLSEPAGPIEGVRVRPGPTPVAGTIAQDTTWFAAGSPYILQGTVTVPLGVTLTVEPGSVIQPRADSLLFIQGRLLAEGKADRAIVWDGEPATPWTGIRFRGGQPGRESVLSHNRLTGAKLALEVENASPRLTDNQVLRSELGLRVSEGASNPQVSGNLFRDNRVAVKIDSADIELAGNVIKRSTERAIEVVAAAPRILQNDLSDNPGQVLQVSDQIRSSILSAQLNWWGSVDEGSVAGAIKGAVSFRPYLDGPPPAGRPVQQAARPAAAQAAAPAAVTPAANPFEQLNQAQRDMEAGKLKEAIAGFSAVAAVAPRNADVQYRLALLHYQTGAPADAAQAIDRAIAISGFAPHFHLTRATIRRDLGDLAGAREALQKVLELKPGDRTATGLLSQLGS
ncbi:MAG: hypothetical protein FJX46_17325 [Alphaproteobacteria bacterium]|nr:hypothetical protein [Alphaproteobacteria bacterium]